MADHGLIISTGIEEEVLTRSTTLFKGRNKRRVSILPVKTGLIFQALVITRHYLCWWYVDEADSRHGLAYRGKVPEAYDRRADSSKLLKYHHAGNIGSQIFRFMTTRLYS